MSLQAAFQYLARVNGHRDAGSDALLHKNVVAAICSHQLPPAGFKYLAKPFTADGLQTVISMILSAFDLGKS